MKAMILAAGRGKRLRPLTDSIPKPLVHVGNKCLIDYHLKKLALAGVKDVIVNTAWLAQKIHQHLKNGEKYNLKIIYSDEMNALESAGGIINALPLLGEQPFLVINGDIWTDFDFSSLINRHAQALTNSPHQAHLVLVNNPKHNNKGDFAICDGMLTNDTLEKFTYSGIAIFKADFFKDTAALLKHKQAYPLAPLLKQKADERKISAQLYSGKWVDVGTIARLTELEAYLQSIAINQ